ncbi:MAG: hypothetical protein ACXWUG_14300 [Polyangiales bacterium]
MHASLPQFDGVRVEGFAGGPPEGEPLLIVLTKNRVPVHAIVVSSPIECDNRLRVDWPRWVGQIEDRLGAPCIVLIVTSDLVVERWAKQPIHLERKTFAPAVLGPSALAADLPPTTPVLLLMTLSSLVSRDA